MEVQRQVAEAVAGQFTPDGVVVKALEWALKKDVSLLLCLQIYQVFRIHWDAMCV